MSVADMPVVEAVRPATVAPRRLVSTRFLRSELGMVFRRRRNQLAIAVLCLVPILIGVAIKLSDDGGNGGPAFLNDITENGIFVAFAALTAVLPLFLPLVVAVVSGDAVSGEAQLGTLRYLLTVPVDRTRLLAVKYAGIVAFCFGAALAVAVTGAVVGLVLFPSGTATLLSGDEVSTLNTVGRLLMVAAYIGVCMAGVGAIGLFISTLTEVPVAAMTATATAAVVSEVLDNLPQTHVLHPWLFSDYWLNLSALMRSPIDWHTLNHGLLVTGIYILLFASMAWARFTGKDISG
jgi:ABC-2 type transport system permease protein